MFIDCHVHLEPFTDTEVGEILGPRGTSGSAGGHFGRDYYPIIAAFTGTVRGSMTVSSQGLEFTPWISQNRSRNTTYETLRDMALSTEKVLVISEVGLDFMEGAPDRAIQYPAFREQIRLARELRLPIVFHSRESHDEAFRVLREERAYEVGGIMHYFPGRLRYGAPYRRPRLLRVPGPAVAQAAPSPTGGGKDSLLRTSFWRRTPLPSHSRPSGRTGPSQGTWPWSLETLAELKGIEVEEVEEVTTRNMRRVLGDGWSVVEKYVGVQ